VETGLVIMPFLPGDSLLFAVGAFSARGSLNPFLVGSMLILGAFIGDILNYSIGRKVGLKLFKDSESKLFNRKYLEKAQNFYKEYGTKTIILARFIPIIRTFAPFVAGVGEMNYKKYISFSIFGATLWVSLFISLGYFFGNLEVVKSNFKIVILAIIFISLVPAVVGYAKERQKKVA
jgi:membrane-associated protein